MNMGIGKYMIHTISEVPHLTVRSPFGTVVDQNSSTILCDGGVEPRLQI